MAVRDRRRLGGLRHGRGAGAAGADVGRAELRTRRLGRPLGNRVPPRCRQCAGAAAGRGDRGGGAALRRAQRCAGGRSRPTGRFLFGAAAADRGTARHHCHGRRLQRVRVPRDLLALDVHADRHGPRSARPHGRVPLPDHGHHRRHVLPDRGGAALCHDRHPEHGRSRGAPAGRGRHAHGAHRGGLHRRRSVPEDRAVPAAPLAAERLCVCALPR